MKIIGRSDFVLSKEIEELLLKPIRLNVHYTKYNLFVKEVDFIL